MLSDRLKQYYGRLRRPPGTPPLPGITGYRNRHSDSTRRLPGRGGPPQFPPPPSERSAPHTPESPSRLHVQVLHRFHGLHPDSGGSALSIPTRRWASNDAAGFALCYGPLSRSPQGAFDAGLRPDPFPDRAASLLPGLLAATRTGLPPAGDDELRYQITSWFTSSVLGARNIEANARSPYSDPAMYWAMV